MALFDVSCVDENEAACFVKTVANGNMIKHKDTNSRC